MKKLLCFLLCLTLIFSSVSLSFAATQDVSDAQTHTILGNLYNLLNGYDFKGKLNNIYNKLVDINANLVTLMGWLDPSSNTSTAGILNSILNALTYTDAGGAIKSWLVDIQGYNYQTAERLLDLNTALTRRTPWSSALRYSNAHYNLTSDNGTYTWDRILPNGQRDQFTYYWTNGTPIGNIALMMYQLNRSMALQYQYRWDADVYGYNSAQSGLSWTDIEQSVSFTPNSSIDGTYKWLKNIQAPVARLAYVLASDERIAAQDAAAANEEAVVDNFIDSSGDGAASPSDIGSVSDLSSGYKQNFGSDASPSGIFDIFNADHATWFSQETKNQLDTTTPTRLTKGSESETPLLDKQIEDIYNALGVKQP